MPLKCQVFSPLSCKLLLYLKVYNRKYLSSELRRGWWWKMDPFTPADGQKPVQVSNCHLLLLKVGFISRSLDLSSLLASRFASSSSKGQLTWLTQYLYFSLSKWLAKVLQEALVKQDYPLTHSTGPSLLSLLLEKSSGESGLWPKIQSRLLVLRRYFGHKKKHRTWNMKQCRNHHAGGRKVRVKPAGSLPVSEQHFVGEWWSKLCLKGQRCGAVWKMLHVFNQKFYDKASRWSLGNYEVWKWCSFLKVLGPWQCRPALLSKNTLFSWFSRERLLSACLRLQKQ